MRPWLNKGKRGVLVIGLILQACGSSTFEGRIRYQASIAGEAAQALEPFLRDQKLGFTLQQKGDKIRIDDAAQIIIVDYGLDSVYVLFRADSSYLAMRLKDGTTDSLPKLTVTPLPDKREIAGYTCTGKRATYEQEGRTYEITFWEAQALKPPVGGDTKFPILPRGVKAEGIPLRIETSVPEQPFSLIYEAVEVQKSSIEDKAFVVPLSFKKSQ